MPRLTDQERPKKIDRGLEGRGRKSTGLFSVNGRVTTAEGSLADALVRAVDKDRRRENLLGETHTDRDGNYRITYSESQFRVTGKEMRGPDLTVRVYSAEGKVAAESKLKRNASREEIVDLMVASKESFAVSGAVRRVSGTVRRGDGRPAAGTLLRAYDQDLHKKQLLGKAATDSAGHYRIPYTSRKLLNAEKTNADLSVTVVDAQGKELVKSEVLFNAPEEAVIDLTLPPDGKALSEFERLLADVLPLLAGQGKGGADLKTAELEEHDIGFLSREIGQPQARIAFLVAAAKAALATSSSSGVKAKGLESNSHDPAIPLEAFYGWFRQNLPTSLAELLGKDLQELRAALERSVRDNIIPIPWGRELDGTINELRALKANLRLKP